MSIKRCVIFFALVWPLLLSFFFLLSVDIAGLVTGGNPLEALELTAMVVFSLPSSYITLVIPAIILGLIYYYLVRRYAYRDENYFAVPAFYTGAGAGLFAAVLMAILSGSPVALFTPGMYVEAVVPTAGATFVCVLLIERPRGRGTNV